MSFEGNRVALLSGSYNDQVVIDQSKNRKHDQIRYQLTYPHEGSIIHSSKSKANAIKKCYKEFKRLNGINDGLFSVTDLDNKIEYQFKVRHNQIIKMSDSSKPEVNPFGGNMQMGGDPTPKLNDSPMTPKLVSAKDNVKNNDLMQHIRGEPVAPTNNAPTIPSTMPPLITTHVELQQGSAAPEHVNKLPKAIDTPVLPVSTTVIDPVEKNIPVDLQPKKSDPSDTYDHQKTLEKVSEYKHETREKIEELEILIQQKLQSQQDKFNQELARHKEQITTLQNQLAKQQAELKGQYQNIDKNMQIVIKNTKEKDQLLPELPKMGERTKEQIDQKIYEICDKLNDIKKDEDDDECVII